MREEIKTICNRDCPDSCGIIATVENGRIVKQKGDPDHGVTAGFLCQRGNHYLDRFYSEERILHPQLKTEGGWKKISWEEALDIAAEKLRYYREKHGAQSIAYISYSGIRGLITKTLSRKFWDCFGGVTLRRGGLSTEAIEAGQLKDFGGLGTHAPDDLTNSKAIVIWGKNVAVTRVHCWPFIKQARKKGARLIVIDPVNSRTAQRADLHLAIRPGSDGMLAAGIARQLIENDRYDHEFTDQFSTGFEEYKNLILSIPMQDILSETGLQLSDINELTTLYAEVKPLATLIGLGPSYWSSGGATVRMIDALAAISGNVGIPGGGAQGDIESGAGLDLSDLKEPLQNEYRSILMPKLGEELLNTSNPPLKMGFIAGANPAATCPDTNKVREGLSSLDFLIVVDQFMTASAEVADLFLPCTTYLEMEDLVIAYGHYWLGLCQQVVPPRGECKPDYVIFQKLADRLGFGNELSGTPGEWIDRFLTPLHVDGITYETLKNEFVPDPRAETVPYSNKNFTTESGKYEFIRNFTPNDLTITKPQLRLMATKTLKMVNAQINQNDIPSEPVVRLHPQTLKEREVGDNDRVRVTSKVASVEAIVKADPEIQPGILLFNPAAWQGDLMGVNQLRESFVSDIGKTAAMHETLVTIERV